MEQSPTIYPVDAEHSGIRTVGCITLLLGMLAGYVLASLFQVPFFFAVLVALLVGSALSWAADRSLKGRWASGRQLVVGDEQLRLEQHGKPETTLDPTKLVNVLLWYFTVPRAARVPKGWHVVALGLEQADQYITLYTFLPPDGLDELPSRPLFTGLIREKDLARENDMRVAGVQRRLRVAETHRGIDGAEITREQFVALIGELQTRFSKWMPQ